MNINQDTTPDKDIKPPPRMPMTEWDKFETDIKKGKEK